MLTADVYKLIQKFPEMSGNTSPTSSATSGPSRLAMADNVCCLQQPPSRSMVSQGLDPKYMSYDLAVTPISV